MRSRISFIRGFRGYAIVEHEDIMEVAYRVAYRDDSRLIEPQPVLVDRMTENTELPEELLDPTAYIAPGAVVLGDVTIGAESSVWFNAVVRGDTEAIRIGTQTNVQDLCVLHADAEMPCVLGDRVTLGHAAIVHGATVEDDCMIGMRAVVMNGATIGRGSIVAVGAVVTEGTVIPPGSVVMGLPGKVIRSVTEQDTERIAHAAAHYSEQANKLKR
jgi:carbonic anhydrase/acetyltransferase-like protein (isoleucine patch superfamily)